MSLDEGCEDIEIDIEKSLPENLVAELRTRLDEAANDEAYFGVLLNMAWRCRGAPTLAQRVINAMTKAPNDG